ncbi:MAG: hypothetical protein ACIAXF_11815 [Phycisphaerales bacterium JB063]
MAKDLDKQLYTALHGKLSLQQRRSLVRRFGGWSVFVPTLPAVIVLFFLANLLADFIKFHFGGAASALVMVVLITLAVYGGSWFIKRRNRRVGDRVMSYLERQGIRPHLCLNCEYDLKGSVSEHCPECGTALAPVMVEHEGDTSPQL